MQQVSIKVIGFIELMEIPSVLYNHLRIIAIHPFVHPFHPIIL